MKRISPQPKSIENNKSGEQMRGLSRGDKVKLGALTLATAAVATGLLLHSKESAPESRDQTAIEYTQSDIEQARDILAQVPGIRELDPEVEHILVQKGANIHHTRASAGLDNLDEQLTGDTLIETPGGVGEVTGDNPANGEYTVYVDLDAGQALFVQSANLITQ